jgi:DNA repair exonuclease SbcCD ATPase subunit
VLERRQPAIVEDPGPEPSTAQEKYTRDQAADRAVDANSAHAAFKETKRIMEETFECMAAFAGLALQHAQEEADWRKLANLIGRDGIQSALVDAAGPELSETVNYFLHTCFGNRWSQTISTQRESSDGKKTIEQCKVWVIDQGSEEDNAPAREGEGITFSGGEQEILSLAFQLALTYLARNSGIVAPDIYLDEPASSLNESMRAKWVQMLRVAAGLIGCKHIHFISHNEDVKRLADARVKIEKGTATIVQGDNNGQ